MKKSLKFVQLKIRLAKPFGSECFATEDEGGNGDKIKQPLNPTEVKDVVIEMLRKLANALSDGTTSIPFTTDAGGNRLVHEAVAPIATSLIDLNKANKTRLRELPGIGPATAAKIIEHRPYNKVEDLIVKIESIDEELVKRIRSLVSLTVDGSGKTVKKDHGI